MKMLVKAVLISSATTIVVMFLLVSLVRCLLRYIRKLRKICDIEAQQEDDIKQQQNDESTTSTPNPNEINHPDHDHPSSSSMTTDQNTTSSRKPDEIGSHEDYTNALTGELHLFDDGDDSYTFTTMELSKASAQVLGNGFHGTTYETTFEDVDYVVTVKWLRAGILRPKNEFMENANKFANMRHPNLVPVRGYLWGSTQYEIFILSEYICSRNLACHLYGKTGTEGLLKLTWAQRLKIASDVARAVEYLHIANSVPHGNLKPANILISDYTTNITAKLTDYNLQTLLAQAAIHDQTLDAGLLGYGAPELTSSSSTSSSASMNLPSFKSDIYAFGVILLEILTGKCAGTIVSWTEDGRGIQLIDWVRLQVSQGRFSDCFDPVLMSEEMIVMNTGICNQMKGLLGIALRCVKSEVLQRPRIETICQSVELLLSCCR